MAGGYYAGWQQQRKGPASYGYGRPRTPGHNRKRQGPYTVCSCGTWIYNDRKGQSQYCSGCGTPWAGGSGVQGKTEEEQLLDPTLRATVDLVLGHLPEEFRTQLYKRVPVLAPASAKPGYDELRRAADTAHKEFKQAAEKKHQLEKKQARLQKELEEVQSQLDKTTQEVQQLETKHKQSWAQYTKEVQGTDKGEQKPAPEGSAKAGDKEADPATASTAASGGGEQDASMGDSQSEEAPDAKGEEPNPSPEFEEFKAGLDEGKRALLEQEMARTAKRQKVKGAELDKVAQLIGEALGKQAEAMGPSATWGQQRG